ncbi:MAG: SUMF1/EgtB/PvdO family nonheme iron enzyme, partial [Pseudomonadota bacterium]
MKYDQNKIVWLEGGPSLVGTARPEIPGDGESPPRKVKLKDFGMAKHAVTAREFAAFVNATGYRTDAEKFGWSYVFEGMLDVSGDNRAADAPWWVGIDGACWSAPVGPGSRPEDNHPATHISGADAQAFANWCGGRLPTEAEWEYAARGGSATARYPWGDAEPDDEQAIFCNIWQGGFPETNTAKDGYVATAPVDSFEPNPFGLFNMAGNVWEWCSDRYRVRSLRRAATRT